MAPDGAVRQRSGAPQYENDELLRRGRVDEKASRHQISS